MPSYLYLVQCFEQQLLVTYYKVGRVQEKENGKRLMDSFHVGTTLIKKIKVDNQFKRDGELRTLLLGDPRIQPYKGNKFYRGDVEIIKYYFNVIENLVQTEPITGPPRCRDYETEFAKNESLLAHRPKCEYRYESESDEEEPVRPSYNRRDNLAQWFGTIVEKQPTYCKPPPVNVYSFSSRPPQIYSHITVTTRPPAVTTRPPAVTSRRVYFFTLVAILIALYSLYK